MSLAQLADEHARGCQALQKVAAVLQELGIAGVAPQLVLGLYRASMCHADLTVKSWEAITSRSNASYLTTRGAELGLLVKIDDANDKRATRVSLTDKGRRLIEMVETELASRGRAMERAGRPPDSGYRPAASGRRYVPGSGCGRAGTSRSAARSSGSCGPAGARTR